MTRQKEADGFERVVAFYPAWDERPGPRGQHVVDLHFALVGPAGAVSICVFTGWTWADGTNDAVLDDEYRPAPMCAGLNYHERTAGSELVKEDCEYLGSPCYDGGMTSMLGAASVFHALIRGGEDALWTRLRDAYDEHWGSR